MRIYLFSPIPYTFLHQRPQNIAEELLLRSVDVTFIEPYGLTEFFAGRKKLRFRDPFTSLFYHLTGLWHLLFPQRKRAPGNDRTRPKSFELLTLPFVLPSNRLNSSFLDRLNGSVYRAWLRRTVLRREGCRNGDVALVQQPYFGTVIEQGDFTRMYYDCIDDPGVFSGRGSRDRLRQAEGRLLGIADAVFVTGAKLEEDLAQRVPDTRLTRIPNGVNTELFQERASSGSKPADLARIKGPVAGYMGILRAWFDYEFIERLAVGLPDVSFVLVGPYEETPAMRRVKPLKNVHFLGRKQHQEVPSYIRGFDLGLIPFRKGEIAETTNPVKVFEYFALGKPVVSTWLRELVSFHERGLLTITDHDGCVEAVRDALADGDEARAAHRRAVAADHSWKNLVKRMAEVMDAGAMT